MNRILILIGIMLLPGSTGLYAQRAQIGLKGGVNFSSLHTQDAAGRKMLPGFNNGFFARLPLMKKWSFQPEIYYTTKGADLTYNTTVADGTVRYKFSYVEMPLILVAHIKPYFNIQGGAYVAFLLDSEVKNRSGVALFNYERVLHRRDFNRMDAGMMLGIGFDLGAFGTGLRYSYGFVKVGKERSSSGNILRFPDAGNSGISTYIAYSFN